MNTGQTISTIGAMILLTKILIGFYGVVATNGVTLGGAESSISQISLAASYFERAQGLSFDEATVDTFVNSTSLLTDTAHLGIESMHIIHVDSVTIDTIRNKQNDLASYNDFDDFNGTVVDDTTLASSLGSLRTTFNVY